MSAIDFEFAVIGAGVVGLAIASRLSERHPSIVVLERNEHYGMETSSRNSEVIHAGIYYAPGSLKAALCVEGREELYSICAANAIPHSQITKIISAWTSEEVFKLEEIQRNAAKNGVDLRFLDARETQQLEPNIRTFGSLLSPRTGIISAHGLMDYFYRTATERGATVQRRCEVAGIERVSGGYRITVSEGESRSSFTTEKVVNAAGLFSDKVAALAGVDIDAAGYRLRDL